MCGCCYNRADGRRADCLRGPMGFVERAVAYKGIRTYTGHLAPVIRIVTTEANEIMTSIHKQMPVIHVERD